MAAEIIILPARNCRRSKKVREYLDHVGLPYQRIELESSKGQKLAGAHGFLASPGILVNGESITPYEILVRGACRIDGPRAKVVFAGERKRGVL